jgi:hypothetical protein
LSEVVELPNDGATDPERRRVARPTPSSEDTNTATMSAVTPARLGRFGGVDGGCVGP